MKLSVKNPSSKKSKVSQNSFSLKGKTAVVTGGAGILGQKFCRGLAEAGAQVAIVDLNGKEAKELAKKITRDFRVNTKEYSVDISQPQEVRQLVSSLIRDFGEIHILHNNAASKSKDLSDYFASFEDYSLEEWRKVMSVNMDAVFLMAQAVGRQMVKQGKGGSIIQTASIYGVVAPDQRIYEGSFYLNRKINTPAVYAASKAAVIGLTRYLATYWAEQNIRVNCITPGGVESGQNEIFKENYSRRVPLGRMAQADELVGALIYLASDASSYVTGQNIIVDGGLSAW